MAYATDDRPYLLPAHHWLGEPLLAFHPTHDNEQHRNPLEGLRQWGPYSRGVLSPVMDPVRVGIIAPHGQLGPMRELISELARPAPAIEGRPYRPDYPGFRSALSLNVSAPADAAIELPAAIERELDRPDAHLALAAHVLRAVQQAVAQRAHFDVLAIYIPKRWERAIVSPTDPFFLHDQVKAAAAQHGVSTQLIRESHAIDYRCRAKVLWHLAIALYVKAGGVPWKLAEPATGTAYVGLSYALRTRRADERQYVICCSQIFDSDGAGLEFLLYETSDLFLEGDDPFLSRQEMRRVIGRSVQLYQRRNLGRLPEHLVVHKTTEFKDAETQGVFDACSAIADVELVQVQQGSPWRGIHVAGAASIHGYPIERGTFLQLGGRSGVLWTAGNAPTAVAGGNYFKEGRATPEPLEIIRYAGRVPIDETATAVLALTKMDWNNDALYDRMPVTVTFAQRLARVAKNMPDLTAQPYPLRLFM